VGPFSVTTPPSKPDKVAPEQNLQEPKIAGIVIRGQKEVSLVSRSENSNFSWRF